MAAVRLTEGAIVSMMADDADPQFKPILQVTDLRQIQTQSGGSERYRLNLSDGCHVEQGMLATQYNTLVHQRALLKGSIVCLSEFTCTKVQKRRIIIIVSLSVLVTECEIIGQPVRLSNAPSPATASGNNTQSLHSGVNNTQSLNRGAYVAATPDQPRFDGGSGRGGSYTGNAESGRYAAASSVINHPRPESGSSFNTGLHGPRPQVSPVRQSSYAQPPQPSYQQSRPNSYVQPLQSTYQQAAPLNTYARTPQLIHQQPPPFYSSNRGPAAKNEASGRIVQICALNQYQGRWKIKARVAAKSELRSYTNARGNGKVFSFDLIDSDGEIRVTCFNNVAEEFYELIEVGKVYLISKGTIKTADKKFNHLNNEYEITLDATSVVQVCFDDDGSIPHHRFNFRPISDIECLENNTIVDLIGVVSIINPASSIRTKNGETQKRTLQLKDMSGRSVEATLWGSLCNVEGQKLQGMCDSGLSPVLAVKAARVGEFNGKVVGTTASSQLFIEPNDSQADQLRIWYEREGKNSSCVSISGSIARSDIRKTISQIKDEKLGTSEKPDWITVNATVTFIKSDNCFYPACPIKIDERQCSKKVINNGDGTWRCERCDKSVQECEYRYILNLQIEDHTGTAWVTAFQDIGQEIMGISAKQFQILKYEEQDDDRVAEIIRKVLFTEFSFKLKVKEETFSDEARVKSTVVKADKVDFSSKSRLQLDLIDNLRKGDTAIPSSGMNNAGVGSSAIGQHTPSASVSYGANAANANRVFGAPSSQMGHVGSQYANPRVPPTVSAALYPSCNMCGGTSHNSMNCPNVTKPSSVGSYVNSRPVGSNSDECYKCHQVGHWAKDCPVSNQIPAYGNGGPGRYGASNQRFSY